MIAFFRILREAARQRRTNRIARLMWERLWLRTIPVSFLLVGGFAVCWQLAMIRVAGVLFRAVANTSSLRIMAFSLSGPALHTLLNPLVPLTIFLFRWCYRNSFLQAPDFRTAPLTPAERLWGMLLPAGALAILILAFEHFVAGMVGLSSGPAGGIELSTLVLMVAQSALWALARTPYVLAIGLRGVLCQGARPAAVVRAIGIPIILDILLTDILFHLLRGIVGAVTARFVSVSTATAPFTFQLLSFLTTLLVALLYIPIMSHLLRRAIARAERELFTSEAVERWEARRKS